MKARSLSPARAIALGSVLFSSVFGQEQRSDTPEQLAKRSTERRAVEAVIWGMPAVNAELMIQAMKQANADFNQVTYWSRPVTWRNQTLTPNPDTIYLMPFFNTKDAGPMVLEIPAASVDGSMNSGPSRFTTISRAQW